ncbi:MAG: hypothetical protein V2A70_10215, partial [Candidatus Omnitrophota bacterium]
MTAQVGVLNKRAVALASDSAVTITNSNLPEWSKIFNSENKLFSLSGQHSVGIMIFGSLNFVGIPLETLIVKYRDELGSRKFRTLREYVDDFKDFIRSGFTPLTLAQQEHLMGEQIHAWLTDLARDACGYYSAERLKDPEKNLDDFFENFIREIVERIAEYPFSESSTDEQRQGYLKKYSKIIEASAKKLFQEFPVDEKSIQDLCDIVVGKVFRQIESETMSGIGIAGFGEDEFFPSLYRFGIDAIGDNKIKAVEMAPVIISDEHDSAIVPLAQDDMVYLFMEGIDFDLEERSLKAVRRSIKNNLSRVKQDKKQKFNLQMNEDDFVNKVLEDYRKTMDKHKQELYANPIKEMV